MIGGLTEGEGAVKGAMWVRDVWRVQRNVIGVLTEGRRRSGMSKNMGVSKVVRI